MSYLANNVVPLTTASYTSVTGTLNMDMLTNTTSGWYDAQAFNSMAITIATTTTVTGGVITFEQTDDTTNDASGIAMNVQDSSVLTQTNVTSLTLAASTIKRYQAPIIKRYVRLRISTAFAGTGNVTATVIFKQNQYAPLVSSVNQATAASNAVTATIASGTVTTVSTVTSVTALAAINSVATTNGLSIGTVISAATPATMSVKGTAGRLHFLHVGNPNSSAVYVKVFNLAAPTLGTTSANMNFYIPATSSITLQINAVGLFFSTAIVLAVTGGASLTDNTAITTGCNVNYSFI